MDGHLKKRHKIGSCVGSEVRVVLKGTGGGDNFYENTMYEILKELKSEKVKPECTKIIHNHQGGFIL